MHLLPGRVLQVARENGQVAETYRHIAKEAPINKSASDRKTGIIIILVGPFERNTVKVLICP
jgi:hypothetical protein